MVYHGMFIYMSYIMCVSIIYQYLSMVRMFICWSQTTSPRYFVAPHRGTVWVTPRIHGSVYQSVLKCDQICG